MGGGGGGETEEEGGVEKGKEAGKRALLARTRTITGRSLRIHQ